MSTWQVMRWEELLNLLEKKHRRIQNWDEMENLLLERHSDCWFFKDEVHSIYAHCDEIEFRVPFAFNFDGNLVIDPYRDFVYAGGHKVRIGFISPTDTNELFQDYVDWVMK